MTKCHSAMLQEVFIDRKACFNHTKTYFIENNGLLGFSKPTEYPLAWWSPVWHESHTGLCPERKEIANKTHDYVSVWVSVSVYALTQLVPPKRNWNNQQQKTIICTSNNDTKYASLASCNARMAVPWKRSSLLKFCAISWNKNTNHEIKKRKHKQKNSNPNKTLKRQLANQVLSGFLVFSNFAQSHRTLKKKPQTIRCTNKKCFEMETYIHTWTIPMGFLEVGHTTTVGGRWLGHTKSRGNVMFASSTIWNGSRCGCLKFRCLNEACHSWEGIKHCKPSYSCFQTLHETGCWRPCVWEIVLFAP